MKIMKTITLGIQQHNKTIHIPVYIIKERTMNTEQEFNKLIANITKQQQVKTDLEMAIKRSEELKKKLEEETASLQRKEDYLNHHLHELKKEIELKNATEATLAAELANQKASSSSLQSNLIAMKENAHQANKENEENAQKNKNYLSDVADGYKKNLVTINEIQKTL